jgi:hypothetical protein
MLEEFALFLDDSGSAKPNLDDKTPYFAMGGVLVRRQDESMIKLQVEEFKKRWHIPLEDCLHGNEIRSKKKRFAWLGKLDQNTHNKFMEDLTLLMISCPITVHTCVISRQGYCQRYLEKYGEKTWEMMKSAFSILIERTAKYVDTQQGTIMVYYEKMGKKEDKLIEKYFQEIRSNGHPFNPQNADKYSPLSSSDLSRLLRGIEGKTKNRPEMQLADLCLYPLARSKEKPDNLAFIAMNEHKLLVDCHLPQELIHSLGIKYYCFDNT